MLLKAKTSSDTDEFQTGAIEVTVDHENEDFDSTVPGSSTLLNVNFS